MPHEEYHENLRVIPQCHPQEIRFFKGILNHHCGLGPYFLGWHWRGWGPLDSRTNILKCWWTTSAHHAWGLTAFYWYAWKFHACEKASMLFEFQAVCWSLPQKGQSPHFALDMITGSFFVGLSWTSNLNVDLEFYMQLYALQIWPIFLVHLNTSPILVLGTSWNHVMVQVASHRFYAVSPPATMFGTAFFPKQKLTKKFSWNKIRNPCKPFIPFTFIQKSSCVIT